MTMNQSELIERLKRTEKEEAFIPTTVRLRPSFKKDMREFALEKDVPLAELYRVCMELGLEKVKAQL